jgi:hypothetical protein
MASQKIFIYVSPDAKLEAYPDTLLGDMSVFKSERTIQHEVQWVFYLMLKDQGLDVEICHDYPKNGILLIHRAHVKKFIWNPDLFVVSLQWDYRRDDRAQMHMVSNHFKTTRASLSLLDRWSFAAQQYYVPPIMHPVIIPRDSSRGDLFEQVAFIGDPKNLDKAFRTGTFEQAVEEMGMRFTIRSDPDKMADFSDIDVAMAIRKIGQVISNKPPTKLINAWRGGVPSILGCEIGFREARQNEYDYIEADSVEEVLEALQKLKKDLECRHRMIENAAKRAEPFSAEGQQKTWVSFFKEVVLPSSQAWQKRSRLYKHSFLCVRWSRHFIRVGSSYLWHRALRGKYSKYS